MQQLQIFPLEELMVIRKHSRMQEAYKKRYQAMKSMSMSKLLPDA